MLQGSLEGTLGLQLTSTFYSVNLSKHSITLHPCADSSGRYLTAEVTGDYEGLLRLVIGKNKAGGGQGS